MSEDIGNTFNEGNIEPSKASILSIIRENLLPDGKCLNPKGVAKLCGVAHSSVTRGGAIASSKLDEILRCHGFEGSALIAEGFPPEATCLVLEYFAFSSKSKADQAKQLMRTFGSLGIHQAFQEVSGGNQDDRTEIQPREESPRKSAKRDTIDFINAADKLSNLKVNPQLKQLLEDSLVDELSLNQTKESLPEVEANGDKPETNGNEVETNGHEIKQNGSNPQAKEYTILKVRAKELGYPIDAINGGTGLGVYVSNKINHAFKKRVGAYEVKHYLVCDELDQVIHSYFARSN